MGRTLGIVAAVVVLAALGTTPVRADILDAVQARGTLNCGVNPGLPGFSEQGADGRWSGFDVDYCRAIAAAVLGDADAVTFVPLTTRDRFRELQSGAVDVLVRDTAWTMARDTSYGLVFAGVNYYSGIGFMAPRALGVDSALQLTGARVCVERGSAAETKVGEFFAARGMAFEAVAVADGEAMKAAYAGGACNVATGELIALNTMRLALPQPGEHVVLPDIAAKEPYGPVVLQGDDRWFSVVKWVHFALLNAEELGVTSQTIDGLLDAPNEEIRNLLGTNGAFGEGLGLSNDWAQKAIRAVGNYGEIFDRDLGAGSEFGISRGLNALWTNGGLQFAPPVR